MPDQPASDAGPPPAGAPGTGPAGGGPPLAGSPAVGWRWMGSSEPLFLRVAEQIERFVAGNGLAPGDRLPGERELCELLGVSRASVREALRSLETRGLVRVRHGKGVFVAAPDEGERALQRFSRLREVGLEELFAMREVLEVPAAGWAATEASDEQLASLIATFEQHEQAVRSQAGPEQLRVVDARLHLQIAEYANNRFLTMTQSLLQEMLGRSMDTTLSVAGRPARSVREHAEIVNALVAHDATRSRAAARRHIRSARRAALRRVAEEGRRAAPPG
jgi:GntR family transcriptional regulator, transcriptional repressor for pyruvate dehydrogenase complex